MFKQVLKVKLKVVGMIAVGLIMVQVISAYFFGIIAEKQIAYQFKQITNSKLIKVVSYNYSRGWFRATNKVTLEVNNQAIKNIISVIPSTSKIKLTQLPKDGYQLSYVTHVTHGLLAGWLNGFIAPSIAVARTDIQLPDGLNKILQTFFAGKQPLQISNIIYLNKAGEFGVVSPQFFYEEALSGVKVSWGGINGKVAYDSSFDRFQTKLVAPSLALIAPTKGELNFANLSYNADTVHSPNDLRVGSTELALESLNVNWLESNQSSFKLGEAVHTFTGINSTEFLNSLDAINPSKFSINEVSYKSLSSDTDNFFDAEVKAGFSSLATNGKTYGPFELDLAVKHVLSPEFNRLLEALEAVSTNSNESAEAKRNKLVADLKANLAPIFSHNPVVELNGLNLMTPSGAIKVNGRVTIANFESADLNDQASLMRKLSLDVKFAVPKPILAYFFLMQMKYFLTAGNAQMDQQSSEALAKVVNILLDNQLQVWLKKGYLTESNNQLSSTIRMESGVTTLNSIITK